MNLDFGPLSKACTKQTCTHQDEDHICVDYSEISTARTCEVREYFSYGLHLTSIGAPSPTNPFLFGTIGHESLSTLYSAKTWRNLKPALQTAYNLWDSSKNQDLFSEETYQKIEWAKLWTGVKGAVERYYAYSDEIDKDYEPLAPETPFELCLRDQTPKVYFYGKFDNPVIRKSDNKICIMEFKFHAQMSEDPMYLQWDPQINDYSLAAAEVFGQRWGGIDYRITRKDESKTLVNFVRKSPEETWRDVATLRQTARFIVVRALKIYRNRKLGPIALDPVQSNNPIVIANACYGCEFRKDLCEAFQEGEDWQEQALTKFKIRDMSYSEHENKPEELKVF